MPFEIAHFTQWRIYRDFKSRYSSLSDGTFTTISLSFVAMFGLIVYLGSVPKRKHLLRGVPPKKPTRHFLPSRDWKPVEDDHVCPPGLEYKIDLSTGSKVARKA